MEAASPLASPLGRISISNDAVSHIVGRVAAEAYGVVGSAPNVRIMTLVGTASTDTYVADQYIWMAGFDPQSPVAGFPLFTWLIRPESGWPFFFLLAFGFFGSRPLLF